MLLKSLRDLLLDATNDLVVDTDLHFTSGLIGVVQACRIRLSMFQGEWFLNLIAGIPYFQSILGQKPAIGIAATKVQFRAALLAVEDVTGILSMDVTFDGPTRTLSAKWQVSTAFGDSSTQKTIITFAP